MTDYTCYNNGIGSFLENLSMATDNLSYRELVDHNELMNTIREVVSRADELYALYNPQVIDEHNTSSIAHVDIRQSIQELSAVLESYRTSLSARIDSNVANITAINNDIIEIKETDEIDTSVYIVGPKLLSALNDIISSPPEYDKAIRIGYYTSQLTSQDIDKIEKFVEICNEAGIFEQEEFLALNDTCSVLTSLN